MVRGIIFIDRQSLSFFVTGLTNVVTCQFTPDAVKDLDIVSKDAFAKLITNCIVTNKIPAAEVVIVLASSVVFMKDFIDTPPENTPPATPAQTSSTTVKTIVHEDYKEKFATQTHAFIDNVPFGEVASKIVVLTNGVRVIAANADLQNSVRNIVKNNKFIVDGIAPIAVLDKSLSDQAQFSLALGQSLLMKYDLLRQQSFLEPKPVAPIMTQTAGLTITKGKPQGRRIYILAGVMGLLFLILLYMIYATFFVPQKPAKSSVSVAPSAPAAVTPTALPLSPADVASGSAVTPQTITVQVNNTSTSNQSSLLLSHLSAGGFTNVIIGTQQSVQSGKTLVIFSSDIPAALQTNLFTIVTSVYPNATTLVSTTTSKSVSITIGQ